MTKIYQELVEKLAEQKRPKKRFFNFVDSCVSFFIVSPLVVSYWKGIWCIINYYHEKFEIFPVWPCLLISYAVSASVYYARDSLDIFINGGNDNKTKSLFKTIRRVVIYRIYHYTFSLACIMIWRCIWEIPPMLFKGELWKDKYLHTNKVFFFPLAIFFHLSHFIIYENGH